MTAPTAPDVRGLSRVRLDAALRAGRLVGGLSRSLGRGTGTVVRGRVALAFAPGALRELAKGRRGVIVTGTNGKSTTTRLIAAALGGDVATNTTGANMAPGIVSALDDSPSPTAVLETDELHVPSVARQTAPEVVVLLNLTRDQLDRTHEVSRTSQVWAKALADTGITVVANAADPHVVDAALAGKPVWVDPGTRWTDDATVCPRCGHLLSWSGGRWSSSCGFAMPQPEYSLTAAGVRLPDGGQLAVPLKLPGEVNRGNALFAIATASLFGVPAEVAAARLAEVDDVDGRYARLDLGGRPATLFLAKNPAGWAAALSMIEEDSVLAVGINARIADGTDTSWLYDVPFERLAGRVVGATGDRRDDLAVRLHYAAAEPVVDADPVRLAAKLPPGPLVVAANYTAFREMRRYVA
ncbi:MAG TPA: MurT ligase domain-containing protein [Kineosporiaceae bacterium]|nr:MurT ligase domain-containing protein [Kineosporiaceae bacterium]